MAVAGSKIKVSIPVIVNYMGDVMWADGLCSVTCWGCGKFEQEEREKKVVREAIAAAEDLLLKLSAFVDRKVKAASYMAGPSSVGSELKKIRPVLSSLQAVMAGRATPDFGANLIAWFRRTRPLLSKVVADISHNDPAHVDRVGQALWLSWTNLEHSLGLLASSLIKDGVKLV